MKNKRVRTLLIAALVLVVLGCATWLIARSVRSQTVSVYAVADVAEGYYQDNSELEAQVSEGSTETVPLDEGMVESIAVSVGDTVKKGDLLLTYDTSSYQLTLSSDQAEIAMLQSQIAQAQQDIASYRNMTPSEQVVHTPAPTPTPRPVPGTYSIIAPETQISGSEDGTDYYNCTTKTVVQSQTLLALRDSGRTVSYRLYSGSDLLGVWTVSGEALAKSHKEDWAPKDWTLGNGIRLSGDGTVTVDFSKTHYGSFSSMIPEPEEDDSSWIDDWDEPENGSYYTAAEIAEMIRDKNEEISQHQRELRQAQLKYQRDQLTGKSGEVRAKSDGVVTQVGDPHAISVGDPLVTLKSNTRAEITVYVDELSLDMLKPGDSVNVYTYESGSSFTATVESVGTKPAEDYGYYGSASSFYPVTCVADDESVEVRAWEYCSVTLDSTGSDSNKLYLPLYFVREDNSGSYVYMQGENGKLEQRYISTGAILWGSSVEVRGGLTFEDYVAFPYGRGVQAGNPTQIASPDELYNYY